MHREMQTLRELTTQVKVPLEACKQLIANTVQAGSPYVPMTCSHTSNGETTTSNGVPLKRPSRKLGQQTGRLPNDNGLLRNGRFKPEMRHGS